MNRTTSRPELYLSVARRRALPLRVQLERELRAAIQSGRLRPGAALPSTRGLAGDLGVSRGLVVEAYEQLVAEGYLTARRGAATLVSAARRVPPPPVREPAAVAALRYDFRPGLPDGSMFPRRAWLAAQRRALGGVAAAALGYPDPRGAEPLRAAVASYLNRARGTVATADRVVVCTGFTQGLRLTCHVLRDRGVARVAVEDPCHAEQRGIVAAAGLRPVAIPVDGDGLRVERLGRAGVDAVLLSPAHQFPTGAVLSPGRRAALLDWARRRRGTVIEDDYDAEYRYDREPIGALQGLAPDRVVHAGSLSKTLAPALRLGWLVVPRDLVADVAAAKRRDDLGSPTLEQLACADFLGRGELDRHLRRTRLLYRRRRDALVAALRAHLPDARIDGVAAGLHLMVALGGRADEPAIVAEAARRSVGVYPVAVHRARPRAAPAALLLGYGAVAEADIDEGVRRLAAAVRVGALSRSSGTRARGQSARP